MKTTGFLFLAFVIWSCSSNMNKDITDQDGSENGPDRELIYQYSAYNNLANLIFNGQLTVKELMNKGDVALGTFNGLDGEMIMVDGELYQILEDEIKSPGDDVKIPYCNATWFDPDITFEINEPLDYKGLREHIMDNIPSSNFFYAFKITGEFNSMKCGGIEKQERPYTKELEEIIEGRPVFDVEDVSGIMVGFYSPEFIGNLNASGIHLHFISDDRKMGGHVMEFESNSMKVKMDQTLNYQLVLSDKEEFKNSDMRKEFRYGN